MKSFTWTTSGLSSGLNVQDDSKLGQIVFLGEEGRGRRYEKVGISRRNPAEILDGRVMNANPVKITLPAKDSKPEKSFFVLERPRFATQNVLVQINSNGGYVRGGHGGWKVVEGNPETMVSGYGAFGDAGRTGNWNDGIVLMHPGDVVKIHPSRTWGSGDSALWLDETGTPQTASWQDYEMIMAIHTAEEIITDVEEKSESLELLAGQMSCFSFTEGKVSSGLKLKNGNVGVSVCLGEHGRGRKLVEVPVVGGESATTVENSEVLQEASVVDLGNEIFGLVQSENPEPNAFLVRVCTGYAYTRRGNGSWELWKGSPVVVTMGYGADGDAGGIGSWDDGLLILREGDVVRVRPSGDGPSYALFVKEGKVKSEPWIAWKVADAQLDPIFYVTKGTAPWGHTPSDWIGRIVTTMVMGETGMRGGSMIPSYSNDKTGELISVEPFVLNLGWDGCDYSEAVVKSALWVVLTDKKVRQLEGEELERRQLLRAKADKLCQQAKKALSLSYFKLTEAGRQEKFLEISRGTGFDTMPTEGWSSLTSWVRDSEKVLEKFFEIELELKSLEERQLAGEILRNFESWSRSGGMTNCGNGWVIRADGSLRQHDSDDIRRHKSDGNLHWDCVFSEELALRWHCSSRSNVAKNSTSEVVKAPVGGYTKEQLATVAQIEDEIEAPRGAFGFRERKEEVKEEKKENDLSVEIDRFNKIFGH